MYAGHAAIALAIKSRAPRTAIAILTVAAFGPDWTELVLALFLGRGNAEMYSHCIPGVVLGATCAWILAALFVDRTTAGLAAVAWLSHWPADFLTAYKPLLDPHHVVGLDLYQAPLADFALEGTLVVIACVLYIRAFAPVRRQRNWMMAAGAVLVSLQGMLDFGVAHADHPPWEPKLASRAWRPHLSFVVVEDDPPAVRMALAFPLATFTASEQWRQVGPAASSPWSV